MKRCSLLLVVLLFPLAVSAESLASKAGDYQASFIARNAPPVLPGSTMGGTLTVVCEGKDCATARGYKGAGDSTIWTAMYLMTQAFRYAADPAEQADALYQARQAVAALHLHLTASGRKGFVARYVGPAKMTAGKGRKINCPGTADQAKSCAVIGDTSRDQYVGYFTGMGAAYELIPDPVLRQSIRDDLRVVIDRLISDRFIIVGRRGNTGLAADLQPHQRQAILLIASRVLDDPDLRRRYLLEYRLLRNLDYYSSYRRLNTINEYFAFNLDHLVYYNLITLDPDPAHQKFYRWIFEHEVYGPIRYAGNVFFDYIHLVVIGGRDAELERNAVEALGQFHFGMNVGRAARPVAQEASPAARALCQVNVGMLRTFCLLGGCRLGVDVEKGWLAKPKTKNPKPFPNRQPSDFIWQRDPKSVSYTSEDLNCGNLDRDAGCKFCGCGEDRQEMESSGKSIVYPGLDFLLPYWMGRKYGYLGAEQ